MNDKTRIFCFFLISVLRSFLLFSVTLSKTLRFFVMTRVSRSPANASDNYILAESLPGKPSRIGSKDKRLPFSRRFLTVHELWEEEGEENIRHRSHEERKGAA